MRLLWKQLTFVLIMSSMILLSACGFHLKPPIQLITPLKVIYINTKTPYDPFVITLKRELEANGVDVVDKPTEATAILNVQSIDRNSGLASVMGSAQAGTYNVSMSVTFNIITPANVQLLPATTLSATQSYVSNATQIVSSGNTEFGLREQNQENIASQIINTLSSIQPQVLQNNTSNDVLTAAQQSSAEGRPYENSSTSGAPQAPQWRIQNMLPSK